MVRYIPRGKVATYQAVAAGIGNPRASRAVGNALNKNRNIAVPCHRVIRADGHVGGYAWGGPRKIALLAREGVAIRAGRITDRRVILYRIPSWKQTLFLK